MNTKRILVVEDDSSIRRGLVDALEFSGYEVLQASDGDTVPSPRDHAAIQLHARMAALSWQCQDALDVRM